MKLARLSAFLAMPLAAAMLVAAAGCNASANTPPTALAPGYSSVADQQLGQSLAAANALVLTEKDNYQCAPAAATRQTCLTAAQQAAEKSTLNTFIDAVTVANAAYSAFHAGSGTLATAQTAMSSATTAQSNLTASKTGSK